MVKPSRKQSSGPPEVLMLGYLAVKDFEDIKDKVRILDRFNLTDAIIAQITGSNSQGVRDARRRGKNKPVVKRKKG